MARFYDVHCHMMNLSHPNLSAIIRRIYVEVLRPLLKKYLIIVALAPIAALFIIKFLFSVSFLQAFSSLSFLVGALFLLLLFFLSLPPFRRFMVVRFSEKLSNVMNLLAAMETDIGDCLIQLEEDLRRQFPLQDGLALSGQEGAQVYDSIVLTPLVMDFGLKEGWSTKQTYKVRWKPIVAQVEDLFLGIRDYYRYRNDYIEPKYGETLPLFRIYPFMGINTTMYRSEKERGADKSVSVTLEKLLEKNFGEFGNDQTPQQRRQNLEKVLWAEFNGNIDSVRSYYFLGLKVYPPLGFNPWPEPGVERDKVRVLYEFCVQRNIPITAHCSPGGFLVNKAYKSYSSPDRWEHVLQEFPDLRLNLAHFGGLENREWPRKIVELLVARDPVTGAYRYQNLYTDLSYQCLSKRSYDTLKHFIDSVVGGDAEKRARLMDCILFGSDFMINLQDISTYSDYVRFYAETDVFTAEQKDRFCRKNSERFLFVAQ